MPGYSVSAITIIDIFVVVTVVSLVFAIFRLRPAQRPATPPSIMLTATGLCLMGALFLLHLLGMHVLPFIIGAEPAERIATFIHLDAKWVVVAAATPLICVGFILSSIERRRTIDQLSESEARYRSVVMEQLDMIVRWRGDGVRTWVNEPYCRMLGISESEAVGTSFFPVVGDLPTLIERRDALSPARPTFTEIVPIVTPDGATQWQEWVSRGVFDESGALLEVQSIGRDVTNRLSTEHALRDSESRFKGIVENTHDWVWEANMELLCLYSNRQCERILGFSAGEITGLPMTRLMHPESVEQLRAEFSAIHAAGQGWRQWQLKFLHKNGRIRFLESSADPVRDASGRIVGYRGINRDRTFESLLVDTSLDLTQGDAGLIDELIDRCLMRIGQSYEVDRISVWWIREPLLFFGHGWARQTTQVPHAQVLRIADFPIASEKILVHARAHKINSIDQLAADSIERGFMRSQNIRSMMILPLQHDGSVIGIAVCTTSFTERDWSEQVETELRLLLDKVADARRQADSTLELVRSEKDLAQSEELAHVGSFAFFPRHDAGPWPEGWAARFSSMQRHLLEATAEDASLGLFMSRIHENDRERIELAFSALVGNGSAFEEEFRFVNPSGNVVHVASRAELEKSRDESIARIVGSCRDITDQVSREHQLMDAVQEIEALREGLEEENVHLREEIRHYTEFEQIVGENAALRTSLDLAAKAAASDAAILILGETGTGKELVAKAIHKLSNRSSARLVSVNCTALPASLIESELFGHEKGAFTGATSRRAGRFELADGGTLFLDEIGDLPLDLQARLLRVLEDGCFERLGGDTTLHANVRLIAATNRDLTASVRAGFFRADLYYRISTVPIELPPLRERRDDIPSLAHHFVAKHNARLGKNINAISTRMLEHLQRQDWPGNVRELENFIERSIISATGQVLTIAEPQRGGRAGMQSADPQLPVQLRSFERDHIVQELEKSGWIIDGSKGAAAAMGLAPSTLRSKMKRLGIERPAQS